MAGHYGTGVKVRAVAAGSGGVQEPDVVGRGGGTGLVVIGQDVVLAVSACVVGAFASVAGVAAPVVHDIVDYAQGTLLGGDVVVVDAGIATVVVGEQVVVVGGVLSAPDAAVAVGAFLVDRHAQALRYDVPLEAEVGHTVEGRTFIGTPADGTVVDDDVLVGSVGVGHYLDGVVFRFFLVSHTAADEAHDDVARRDAECVVFQADTVSRGCLAGNGEVAFGDVELLAEFDDAGHVEDYGKGPAFLLYAVAEGAGGGGVVLERSHVIDFAAATATGVHSASLGSGESARLAVLFAGGDAEFIVLLGASGVN